jgi:hypothetical protein
MPNIAMNDEQNKSIEPTPDQLLRMLVVQIAAQRSKRTSTPQQRGAYLAAGVLIIIFAAFASLIVLSDLARNLPRQNRDAGKSYDAENSQ